MNNREREFIAAFLCDLEDQHSVNILLMNLNDVKLQDIFDSYGKISEEMEYLIEKIQEKAIEFWNIDFPEHEHLHWCLAKSYKNGNYWESAALFLKNEFELDDDLNSVDLINIILNG